MSSHQITQMLEEERKRKFEQEKLHCARTSMLGSKRETKKINTPPPSVDHLALSPTGKATKNFVLQPGTTLEQVENSLICDFIKFHQGKRAADLRQKYKLTDSSSNEDFLSKVDKPDFRNDVLAQMAQDGITVTRTSPGCMVITFKIPPKENEAFLNKFLENLLGKGNVYGQSLCKEVSPEHRLIAGDTSRAEQQATTTTDLAGIHPTLTADSAVSTPRAGRR